MTPDPGDALAERWDATYAHGDRDRSWYQEHALTSMSLIQRVVGRSGSVVDVGGGASTLVDDLLDAGFADICVLDVSDRGLSIARDRLGDAASTVRWVVSDLRDWTPDKAYDIWHDRAVLHFLTEESDRAAYRDVMLRATAEGSHVVIGVFGPQGPQMCSGSTVRRQSPDDVAALLGDSFELLEAFTDVHQTPSGAEQEFLWTLSRRVR